MERFHFSQGENSSCCPIAVILSRILYERPIDEYDFKRSIQVGTIIWKRWLKNSNELLMHFFNVKNIEPRLIHEGSHTCIVEMYGNLEDVECSDINTAFGFKTLWESLSKIDRNPKYAGVMTCNSISLCIGKRGTVYYLCDSHPPMATIIKTYNVVGLYKNLLAKIGAGNPMYEINVFI